MFWLHIVDRNAIEITAPLQASRDIRPYRSATLRDYSEAGATYTMLIQGKHSNTIMSGSFYRIPTGTTEQQAMLPRSVLCVQPNAGHQQFLQPALADYRVVMVEKAFDAIRSINRSVFDAYVLDYWLPDWTGAALCRDIRKNDPHVPIICYTTAGDEYRVRALRAGATDYIRPPVPAIAFRERLRMLIQSADVNSLRARIEAECTIQDELRRQLPALKNAAYTPQRGAAAIEPRAKVKAAKVFIGAGGTRSCFERIWPQQFAAACANEGLKPWPPASP
jgi:CheY-like chemotaxis protein